MRAAALICGLVLLGGVLAACGGGGDSAPAEQSAGEAASADDAPTETSGASEATDPPEPEPSAGSATCELTVVPSQVPLEGGITHVEELPEGFAYNSVPASQGPHHPQWLRWGIYDEPVPELNVVHNLEHGGITVQYGFDVPGDIVEQILAWYGEDSNAVIVAPYEALGAEIALAAWTVEDLDQSVEEVYRSSEGNVLRCDGFDEAAFDDFRENYRGRAPERIPIEQMPAGS